MAILGVFVLGATAWLASVAGMPFQFIFLDALFLTKLIDVLLAVTIVAVVAIGLASRMRLNWAGWITLLLGALASAEALLNVWIASMAVHAAKLEVVAPGLSQALLPLGLGLMAGAAAVLFGRRGTASAVT